MFTGGTTYTGEIDLNLRNRFGGSTVGLVDGAVSGILARSTGVAYAVRLELGSSFDPSFPFRWECTGDVSGLNTGFTESYTPPVDPMDATMDCVFIIDNTNPPQLTVVTEVLGAPAGTVTYDYDISYNSFDSTQVTAYPAVDGSSRTVNGLAGFGLTIVSTPTGATPSTINTTSECRDAAGAPVAFGFSATTAINRNDFVTGGSITCVVTHAAPATLTIVEDVVPDDPAAAAGNYSVSRFRFVESLTSFVLSDGASQFFRFRDSFFGEAVVSRAPTPGFVTTGVECNEDLGGGAMAPYTDVTVDVSAFSARASFPQPGPGTDIICRFIVEPAGPPQLELDFDLNAVDDSAYADFNVEVRGPSGALIDTLVVSPTSGRSSLELTEGEGTYSLTVANPQGLDIEGGCGILGTDPITTFSVLLGETASCQLFLSEPFPTGTGSLTLVKDEEPDAFDYYDVDVMLGDYLVSASGVSEGLDLVIPALADGVYTVIERGTDTDYQLVAVTCSDATTSTITNETFTGGEVGEVTFQIGTFTLNTTSPGSADVRCVLRNEPVATPTILRIVTEVEPSGSTQTFDYTLSPASSVTGAPDFTQQHGDERSVGVTPGDVITVAQTAVTGYDTALSCYETGTTPTAPSAGNSTSVTLGDGTDLTCRFVNTAVAVPQATLAVESDVVPDFAGNVLFNIDPASAVAPTLSGFGLADGATTSFTTTVGGAITINRLVFSDYRTTSLCTIGVTVVATGDASITYTPADGDDVVCSFVHRRLPTLAIVEDVAPDGLGLPDSTFSASPVANLLGGPNVFALGDTESVELRLEPGAETGVSRSRAVGVDADGSVQCTDASGAAYTPVLAASDQVQVDLSFGEDITCTFRSVETPPPALGDLGVGIDHQPDAPGVVTEISAAVGPVAVPLSAASITGDGVVAATDLADGVYTATATYPYAHLATRVTGDPSCALGSTVVNVVGGVSVSRTTTFTAEISGGVDQACALVLEPAVLSANIAVRTVVGSGLDATFDYTVSPAANVVGSPTFTQGAGDSNAFEVTVGPDFTISQGAVAGFTTAVECRNDIGTVVATGTASATVSPVDLDRITCAFTNTPIAPTLTIRTETDPAGAETFDYAVTPAVAVSAGSTSFTQGNADSTVLTIDPQAAVDPDGFFGASPYTGPAVPTVAQDAAVGFDTRVGCYDSDVASAPASFVSALVATPPLALGQNVVCVFQNSVPVAGEFDVTVNVVITTGVVDVADAYSFDTNLAGPGLVGGTSRTFDLGDLDAATVQATDGSDVTVSVPDPLVGPLGFDSSISCNGAPPVADTSVVVTVSADVSCTVTLSARTVSVNKAVDPAPLPGAASFEIEVSPAIGGTGAATLADGGAAVVVVPLGTNITVTEPTPGPYTASITCTRVDPAGPVSPSTGPLSSTNSVSITNGLISSACTVTNTVPTVPTAALTVETVVDPATADSFDYSIAPAAAVAPATATFDHVDGQSTLFSTTVGSLITVANTPLAGFRTTSTCINGGVVIASGGASVSFTPADADDVTCRFTHRPLPTLTLIEDVVPDGLALPAADFTASPTGNVVAGGTTFSLADGDDATVVLEPGVQTSIARSAPGLVAFATTCSTAAGVYTPVAAGPNTLTVAPMFGDAITCTFTSAPVSYDLEVGVDVDPDVPSLVTEFTVARGATPVSLSAASVSGDGSVVAADLADATYSVTATYPYDHEVTGIGGDLSCTLGATSVNVIGGVSVSRTTSFTVDVAGADAACQITLEPAVIVPGEFDVSVELIVDTGVVDRSSLFSFDTRVAGAGLVGAATQDFDLANGEAASVRVTDGTDVTVSVPDALVGAAGFRSSITCGGAAPVSNGPIAVNVTGNVACQITLTARTVTVSKVVAPAPLVASDAFDFEVSPAIGGTGSFTLDDGADAVAVVPLGVTVAVTEVPAAGYDTAVSCTTLTDAGPVSPATGPVAASNAVTVTDVAASVSCTVTNTVVPAPIHVITVISEVDLGSVQTPDDLGGFVVDADGDLALEIGEAAVGPVVSNKATGAVFGPPLAALTDSVFIPANGSATLFVVNGGDLVLTPGLGTERYDTAIECPVGVSGLDGSAALTGITASMTCTMRSGAGNITLVHQVDGASPGGTWPFSLSNVIAGQTVASLGNGDSIVVAVPVNADVTLVQTDARGADSVSSRCGAAAATSGGSASVRGTGFANITCTFTSSYLTVPPTTAPPVTPTTAPPVTPTTAPPVTPTTAPPVTPTTAPPVTPTTAPPVTPTTAPPVTPTTAPTPTVPFAPTPTTPTVPVTPTVPTTPTQTPIPIDPDESTITVPDATPGTTPDESDPDPDTTTPSSDTTVPTGDVEQPEPSSTTPETDSPPPVIIETDGPDDVFVDIGDPIPVEVDCAGELRVRVNGELQDRVDRIEPDALGLGDHVISVNCDGEEITTVRAVVFEQEESAPGGQNMTVIVLFLVMASAAFLFAPTAATRKRPAL